MRRKNKWRFEPLECRESTDMLRNPGRGWYEIHTFRSEEAHVPEVYLNSEDSLVLVRIRIGTEGEELDGAELNRIDRILSAFSGRRDMIVRLLYDLDGKGMESEPSLFCRAERHLEQLVPILKKHAPSIYIYQGMLVGSWGEMHTSRFLSKKHLNRLAKWLVDAAGEEFFLAVRRPCQWRMLIPEKSVNRTTKLSKNESQDTQEERKSSVLHKNVCAQKAYGRIGLFNDGILGSDTDLGTYGSEGDSSTEWENAWPAEEEQIFQENLCRYVPNGGEAVYGEDTERQTLEQIVSRLSRMHVSYLNRCHDERVLSYWRGMKWEKPGVWQGMNGFDYIGRHLGYRFVVRQAEMRRCQEEGKAVLWVTIENVGFSCMYEQAEVFLEYEGMDGQPGREEIFCDVAGWGSGETVSFSHTVPVRAGGYYLSMYRAKDHCPVFFANKQTGAGDNRVFLGSVVIR